jgi:hypothetical protein
MKKVVQSSNLALRFYKHQGWAKDCLEKYLLKGGILDTEFSHHKDPPESAYFIFVAGSRVDLEGLYKNEVETVLRAFDDKPSQSDFEFMKEHL